MDIQSTLRMTFWGLLVSLWGLFMYQYLGGNYSLLTIDGMKIFIQQTVSGPKKKTHTEANIVKVSDALPKPSSVTSESMNKPYVPQKLAGVTDGEGIEEAATEASRKPIRQPESMHLISLPEHSSGAEFARPVRDRIGIKENAKSAGQYPEPPVGFVSKETDHFVLYEEGMQVSKEFEEQAEYLHKRLNQLLVSFHPWTREKKIFVYYSKTQESYRKLTGRPGWSAGAASLSERKIYLYKSPEAMGILAHEMTHIAFDSYFSGGVKSPLWLSEGLATFVQSEIAQNPPEWLSDKLSALQQGETIPLNSFVKINNLDNETSDYVKLWYSEAYSLVSFLMQLRNSATFCNFCTNLKNGMPIDESLWAAYGEYYTTLNVLEKAWTYDLKVNKNRSSGSSRRQSAKKGSAD